MEENDTARFGQMLIALADDCSAQITDIGIEMKFKIFKKFTIDQVEAAIIKVMGENIYNKMPTTGTILQAIEGRKDDKAEFQCSQVVKAIRECGRNTIPNFKDPITKNIVTNHYGWENICNKSHTELPFFEKEFKAKYIAHGNIDFTKPIVAPDRLKKLTKNIGKEIK